MKKGLYDSKWRSILNEFNSYTGTITSFCKENNISKDTFYYYRKKFKKVDAPVFHAVPIDKDTAIAEKTGAFNATKKLRIEIGKVAILITSNETALLSDIIKELVKAC